MSVTDGLASPNTVHPVCLDLVKSKTSTTDTVPGVEQRLAHTHCECRGVGRRHGTPLQYSCLENLMDRRAWWATVQEVTKSQIQLSVRARTHTPPHPHTPRCLIHCLNLGTLFFFNDFFCTLDLRSRGLR